MKNKIKILHLEDNLYDVEMVSEMLRAGEIDAEIIVVNNKKDYIRHLEQNNYDLVISDYSLPEFDGLKALLEAKKRGKDIPFIFCSGTIGEDRAVQCLQLGASDYVLKDRLDRLVPAVKRVLRLVIEMQQRESVEQQLQRVMLAIENIHEAILITDINGKIVYVNPFLTKLYGWKKEEVIGQASSDILKSDIHSTEFYESILTVLKEEKTVSIDMVNKTKDGKYVEVSNLMSSVFDENNIPIGFITIQTDNSLRKQQEREVLKTKKEAEEMNRLKSYFLSNISHELRTPLISILGFSEVLLNELENPELRNAAKYIFESGQRLQNTLDNILTFTAMEKKRIEITNKRLELINETKEVTGIFNKIANRKGLKFSVVNQNKEIWINGDSEILNSILTNVLDNAVKFTSKGEISVTLSNNTENETQLATIKVRDSGIGISPEKIEYAFTPFRQGSEGLNRSFEGMGLGLSLARQMVELLKGTIDIQSQIGKGTDVIIKFPALQSESEIKTEIDLKRISIKENISQVKPSKPVILVVEDNDLNRLVLQSYLNNNFIIDEAENGISAIAMTELKEYDAILMDINLGQGIDGIEALKRIRQHSNCKNIPVVALTAYAMNDDEERLLAEGFSDYIAKPIRKDELIKLIDKILVKQ